MSLQRMIGIAVGLIFFGLAGAQTEQTTETAADLETATGESNQAEVQAATIQPVDLLARDTFRLDSIICPFKGSIDYKPGDIDCFLLEVPENREKPDSRMIELHVVRLNAKAGRVEDLEIGEKMAKYAEGLELTKRTDSVVYLTGGPGARVDNYVRRFKDNALVNYRDLYIIEQRGIGISDDFCPMYNSRNPAADNAETFAQSQQVANQDLTDCVTNAIAAGVDLEGYNTAENARDFKALRRALGFDTWNVWGISYGSTLGQAYLKEDPQGIEAAILDAIMPLEIHESDDHWRVAKWYVRDLEKLQELCNTQPDCADNYPDIIGRLREATQSVIDQPITVEVKDTEVFPSGTATVFHDIVALLPFSLMYEQSNYPALPGLIYAWSDTVLSRDEDAFKALAGFGGAFGGSSPGMQNAILCIDGHSRAIAAASKKGLSEYPILGAALGTRESMDRRAQLCSEIGLNERPADIYTATQTDIPTLIVEGDMDPITPPPNAKAILPGFENGTYVEFPYAGHGPTRSVACAGFMMTKFFDDPTAAPDKRCATDMQMPDVWAPFFATKIAPKMMAISDEPKKLAIPAVWGGLSALVSLIAFVFLTFAPLVRIADGRRAERAGLARVMAWVASTLAVGGLAVVGAAAAATSKASEVVLFFGLVDWGVWGAWALLAGGIAGILTILVAITSRSTYLTPKASTLGFILTGLAAVGLGSFAMFWGLSPF